MNRIAGFEKATKVLGEFHFSEFRLVRELRYYEKSSESDRCQTIDLIVESEGRTPNYQLKLTFCGAAGLRIDDFGGGQTIISGLDIVDISERQWEGCVWEVIDYENDAFAFRAKSVELVSVTPVGM